jgi:corrinoid protein of di/trimethylamine methyltransferase
MGKEELLSNLAEAVNDGDEVAAVAAAEAVIEAGIDPLEAVQQGAVKGLDMVGERYAVLDAFLPDLILAGDAMQACMKVLKPHIEASRMADAMPGKVVIGTVSGDTHSIGKTIVATMLAVSGFEVLDIGIDVPAKQFVEKAEEFGADIIALSALLSTTAYYQQEVIRYLNDSGLRSKYYVVVGGGPITPEWAAEIGADGHGRLATDAPKLFKQLISEGQTPPLATPLVTGY